MQRTCISEKNLRKISQMGAMEWWTGNTGLRYYLLICFWYFSRKMNQKVISDV